MLSEETRKKLNLRWVSDVIGDEYKAWKKGDIVSIQAQTGTGKTFFITGNKEKLGLVDYAKRYGERILYICNRTNLKNQIKKDLLIKFGHEVPYLKNEKGEYVINEDGKKELDLEALEKITTIENVTICSYHAIQYSEMVGNNNNRSDYEWIIADECHYIFSDASFNFTTRLSFNFLFKNYTPFSIKIFISATMEELENAINAIPKRIIGQKPKIWKYSTGTDYSYVDAKYFKEDKDLINLINNDMSGDKWLIFVSNKEAGKKLQKDIKDSKMITAKEADKQTKTDIIANSRFECKCVITTKAMDNGVNFQDKKLKNIVIFAWDRVSFIQMLGRKRVKIDDADTLNLYIKHRYKKSIETQLEGLSKKQSFVDLYLSDIDKFNEKYENYHSKVPNDLFYVIKNDKKSAYKLNIIGCKSLSNQIKQAEAMLLCFEIDKKFAFINECLSWLGLSNTFSEGNYIKDVIDNNKSFVLEDFLKKAYENNTRFDKEEFKETIGLDFDEILNKYDNRHKGRNKGMKLYNDLFEKLELPYAVDSDRFKINNKLQTKWFIIQN